MKIRTTNEIQSLDDDLHLFEEENWNFMSVLDNHDNNYEYFNDIRDTDFDKVNKKQFFSQALTVSCAVAILLTCCLVAVKVTGVLDNSDYNEVVGSLNSTDKFKLQRVDGQVADNEALINISKVLNTYFSILYSEYDYSGLNSCCTDNSNFAETYYNCTSKIITLYDSNDCYARALREFASYCSVYSINDIIQSDDGYYYCYASIINPTASDVYEYIYLYSYNLTKYFKMNQVTEANMMKYLLDTSSENPMTCSPTEYVFKFKKNDDGTFTLEDDSEITKIATNAYQSAIENMSSILGGTLTN